MGQIVQQHPYLLVGAIVALIGMVQIHHLLKVKLMSESDKNYEKLDSQGNVIEKGHRRSIYDWNLVSGLSKLVWTGTWPVVLATVLLIVFLIAYLYTKNSIFGHLLEVNFGLVIGTMVQMVFKK